MATQIGLPDESQATAQPKVPTPIKAPQTANTNPIPNNTPALAPAAASPGMAPPPMTPPTMTAPPQLAPSAPPAIAPAAQTFDQLSAATASPAPSVDTGIPSGPTNDKGQPLGPDGQFHGAQGPTFTTGEGGQPSTVQQPGGAWTNADGSPLAPGTNQWGNATATGPSQTPSPLSLADMQTASGATDSLPNTTGSPNTPTVGAASPQGGYVGSSGSLAPTGAPSIGPAGAPQGVGLNQIDPEADLRGTSVLPTDQVDRTKLMADRMKNYADTELPQYRAKLRSAIQGNAALGRTGSGMLRTDVGNLDLAEQNNLNSKFSDLASNATEGSIQDAANNRNEYRTERGYQTGLEDQAYNRGVQGVTLEDSLTNSAFGRALQQQIAGQANNPAQMQLLLSQIFGTQATGAGNALAQMVKGNASNGVVNGGQPGQSGGVADASSALPQWLMDVLKQNAGTSAHDPVNGDG